MIIEHERASTILEAKGCFINNRWEAVSTGRTIPVVAPLRGLVFAEIAASGPDDVDRAVAVAAKPSNLVPGPLSPPPTRAPAEPARRAHPCHLDELAALEARDCGKPMRVARADIQAAARYFEFYGGAADKVHGEQIPFLTGYYVTGEREPLGVTGHIIPWNYPAQMIGRTLGPALAMGTNGAEARRGRMPHAAPHRRARGRRGFSAGCDQCRSGFRPRSRRCPFRTSGNRFHCLHRLAAGRGRHPDRGRPQSHWLRAGAWWQEPANCLRGRRPRRGAPSSLPPSSRIPGNLLCRRPASGPALDLG